MARGCRLVYNRLPAVPYLLLGLPPLSMLLSPSSRLSRPARERGRAVKGRSRMGGVALGAQRQQAWRASFAASCPLAVPSGVTDNPVTNGASTTQIDQIRRYGKDSSIELILLMFPENPDLWKILPCVALVSPHRNRGCSGPKAPADGAPVCRLTPWCESVATEHPRTGIRDDSAPRPRQPAHVHACGHTRFHRADSVASQY